MRNLRWIIFLPAAILAVASPAEAETYVESFTDGTVERVSISLPGGAYYCSGYSDQYGTVGPSLCLFATTAPTVFDFPSDVYVQGFQFTAGAKNGTTELTVIYDDETTGIAEIDGTCCEAVVEVNAPEGRYITGFSIPADPDLWLFDELVFQGETVPPTTTTTEASSTVPSTTEVPETTTTSTSTTSSTSTSTTSSTVVAAMPPPPPDTQTTVETIAPPTLPSTSVVPSTTEMPATTLPRPTSTTSSAPPTTTIPATTVPSTTIPEPPDTTLSPVLQDDSQVQVPEEPLIQEPAADASDEEKAEFEAQVDVFSGEYDTYVPVGSKISVAERRTVVAVTATLIMFAPPPSRMRRRI